MKQKILNKTTADLLAHAYLDIKQCVIKAGFESEITWQESLSFNNVGESAILAESAWVILNSGMRETVVRNKFGAISEAFFDWQSASHIHRHHKECVLKAREHFNHNGKLKAIAQVARTIALCGLQFIKDKITSNSVNYIQTWPYIGPTTCYHLLKNLGFDIVKPDRHLVRIAKTAGFESPSIMCGTISKAVGDKVSVIDLVLWRYATLEPRYLARFQLSNRL